MTSRLDQFAERLRDVVPDARTRDRVLKLAADLAGTSARELAQRERVAMARRLIDAGTDRTTTTARVRVAYGVSERTARRDLVRAINERGPQGRPQPRGF